MLACRPPAPSLCTAADLSQKAKMLAESSGLAVCTDMHSCHAGGLLLKVTGSPAAAIQAALGRRHATVLPRRQHRHTYAKVSLLYMSAHCCSLFAQMQLALPAVGQGSGAACAYVLMSQHRIRPRHR